jgi:hypothetical protein
MGSHPTSPCVMTNTDQFFVRVCECGVVHLSFGSAVIHVSSKAAIAITETLREVSQELRKQLESDSVASGSTPVELAEADSIGNLVYVRFPRSSS